MTDTSAKPSAQSLGVGSIIAESFSILFGNLVTVIILGFVPMFFSTLISGFLLGWGAVLGTDTNVFPSTFSVVLFVVDMIIQMSIYGLMVALIVQMAYDVKLGRSPSIGRYIGPALKTLAPVLMVSLIVFVLVGIGFVALIVPGLWIYAVFCVIVPAIVIERAGFGAMRRSAALTKDFRWAIVGLLIVVWICALLLAMVFGIIVTLALSVTGGGFLSDLLAVILLSGINGFTYSLSAISVSLIYARLREIKEGVGVDQLASVFE